MCYQVFATFTLSGGKPSLSALSLHCTSEYFPYLVGSPTSLLSQSRYFHTQKEANQYISYLLALFPNCGLARPVLDPQQLSLFPVFAECNEQIQGER